jgi:hypothetical protein
MIAHRRDPENNPIPVRPNPDASFNPRSPEEPQTMRTLRHLQTPEIGPLLQIDHLPLHQDKDNNQNALEALNLEKVAHTTQCKKELVCTILSRSLSLATQPPTLKSKHNSGA